MWSGRDWTVDFHVRTARRSSLGQVLSTGSRAAAHRVSEHVLAAWHDLKALTLARGRAGVLRCSAETRSPDTPRQVAITS